MSRSRKEDKGRKSRGSLAQFGLFDMPDVEGMGMKDDGNFDMNDDDLEDELNMILGTSAKPPPLATKPSKGKAPAAAIGNLDSLIATSLRDEPSDGEDVDIDDDDPNLLAELNELTGGESVMPTLRPAPPPPVHATESPTSPISTPNLLEPQGDTLSILKERLSLYVEAEQAAIRNNDTSKARRYKRGVDQCKQLIKRAEAGGHISQEDIPVPVVIPKPQSLPPPQSPHIDDQQSPSPSSPIQSHDAEQDRNDQAQQEMMKILTERMDQYKAAAIAAKRSNDLESAISHIKVVKQFDVIIKAVANGQKVDMSTMPPPPSAPSCVPATDHSSHQPVQDLPQQHEETPQEEVPAEQTTVLGALEARLSKYVEQEENAKKDGNQSKARRMGRIVKQYKEAVELHKRGKPIPVDELPTPPGFPPIPVEGGGKTADGSAAGGTVAGVNEGLASVPAASPAPSSLQPASTRPSVSPTPSKSSPSSPSKGGAQTRNERQLAMLLQRQKEYREAALKAKMSDNIPKAKEYLTLAKGFEPLIEATRSGLPVDMDTLPRSLSNKKSPEELESFEVIKVDDCVEGTDLEIFDRLLTDLDSQLKMCIETMKHYKAMGDIGNANRFENLASNTRKDINTVRGAHITCSSVPKFHYERRSFTIVRCNVDLNDNDLELNIIKGINYNVPNPKEIDTYVKYEFPLPNDEVRTEKTSTVYNTNNPEYKTVFMIPIQRTSRTYQRLFKRHSIKLHVWSKGGFLRSDQLVATVLVKLQPLETKCTIHEAFDLMDGRKAVGGKLEVRVRLRNPISTKQIEQINEKWLVID